MSSFKRRFILGFVAIAAISLVAILPQIASAQTVDWLLQGLSSLPVDPYAEMSNLDWMSVTGQSDGVQLIGAGLVHHGDYVVAMV